MGGPRRRVSVKRLWSAVLFLAGCAPAAPALRGPDAPGTVTVELDRTAFVLGDSATATITNHGDSMVRFAFGCDGFVEGWTGSGWGTVFEPDCSSLRVMPVALGSGERIARVFSMEPCPAEALDRYREFRVRLRYQRGDGQSQAAYSRPFAVQAR